MHLIFTSHCTHIAAFSALNNGSMKSPDLQGLRGPQLTLVRNVSTRRAASTSHSSQHRADTATDADDKNRHNKNDKMNEKYEAGAKTRWDCREVLDAIDFVFLSLGLCIRYSHFYSSTYLCEYSPRNNTACIFYFSIFSAYSHMYSYIMELKILWVQKARHTKDNNWTS